MRGAASRMMLSADKEVTRMSMRVPYWKSSLGKSSPSGKGTMLSSDQTLGNKMQGWRRSSVKQSVLKTDMLGRGTEKETSTCQPWSTVEKYHGSLGTSRAAARSESGLPMTLPCISDGYSYEW